MYRQITYSSPEEYAALNFWQARDAEYRPSPAYWHRRREALLVRKMPVQDEVGTEEIQVMMKQLLSEQIERVKRLSDEEVSTVYTELQETFALLKVNFDELPAKYSYLSLFRSFAKTKGIEVRQAIEQLQQHFKGKFRIYFNDAYQFIEILTQKHDKFILHIA